MYLVELTYTAPLSEIDAALEAHVEWLNGQYETGLLLASGRKDPRDGGVLLYASMPRADLDAALAKDPFAKLAEQRVVKFEASKTVDALAPWRD